MWFKKILVISFLVLFSANEVNCQSRESGPITAAKEPFITELKISKKERVPVYGYGHIIVRDFRADNSKMGYVQLDSKSRPQQITLPKEGEEYINKIFNQAILPSGNSDTLVLVLNDLWFNETKTEATEAHKLLFGMEKLVSSCYMSVDILLQKNDRFILTGSFDSVAFKKGEWLPGNCDKLLEKSVRALLKTADTVLFQINEMAEVYSTYQLDSLLNKRSDYPVLKAVKLAKGIYFTYDDFLNNEPVDINFTVISDISKRISYPGRTKEDTAWGYCDGENIYMHIANGFYLLNRSQNTYEVMGPAVVEWMNTFFNKTMRIATSYFMPPKGFLNPLPYFEPNKYTVEYYKYFRLNMRNGFLY